MLKIFCEGIGDQIFIADFIECQFEIKFDRNIDRLGGSNLLTIKNEQIEIIPIDGCKKINKVIIKQLFINNSDVGGKNILIFDADYTGINGNNGFQNCNVMIDNLKKNQTNPMEFSHYLWPNNKDDGLFEDLLEKIIPKDKYPVIKCLESNLSCLNSLKEQHVIKVPGIKEKINSYLHLFAQSTKLIERNYNNDFWHLDTSSCEELLAFRQFLFQHLAS